MNMKENDMISTLTGDRISFTFDFVWDALFLVSGVVAGFSWILLELMT